jgi:hypothetical protein
MISVLTVNYRSAGDLGGLAASLISHVPGEPMELIVTNHSPDQVVSLRPDDRLRVKVIESSNRGFAAGVNAAFRESGGETLLIANPDVRACAGALDAGIEFLRRHCDVGVVFPLLRHPDGTVQASVRQFYTWRTVLFARSPLRWLGWKPAFFRDYLCERIDRSGPTDVDWGLGGAMFLRREDCDDGGPFDERFFLYFEDVDLCYRTWQCGRRVVYAPQIECVHAHRRSSRNPLTLAGWHHFRSMRRFMKKHGGWPQRPAIAPDIAHSRPVS